MRVRSCHLFCIKKKTGSHADTSLLSTPHTLHRLDMINVEKGNAFVVSCMNFDGGKFYFYFPDARPFVVSLKRCMWKRATHL